MTKAEALARVKARKTEAGHLLKFAAGVACRPMAQRMFFVLSLNPKLDSFE